MVSENVNRDHEAIQSATSGFAFTCKQESLQWQIEAKKCSCHSSWCESCWKRRGKRGLVDRLQSKNWKRVRHVVLSVDPSLYRDGEAAYDDITRRRGIGKLIKNLERTDKVRIVDYVVCLALHIQRKQEVKEGKQPERKRIVNYTFNELVQEYLIWAERQRVFRSKRGFIKQLVEMFGSVPLRRFNTLLIEQYQTERLQKGNKPATVNRLLLQRHVHQGC